MEPNLTTIQNPTPENTFQTNAPSLQLPGHPANPSNSSQSNAPNGDPPKRRPGRPKGSTRKNLGDIPQTPKVKRPVGRPRKDGLPAGSGPPRNSSRAKSTAPISTPASLGYFRPPQWQQFSVSPYGAAQNSIYPPSTSNGPPPSPLQIDPSLDRDDWAELARTSMPKFIKVLITSLNLHTVNHSPSGITVEQAFQLSLESLTPNSAETQSIPSLYAAHKTFWLPNSPPYFTLTASASATRPPFSEHRFFYWDPQPIVFTGIPCPHCTSLLYNNGRIRTGPIKVYDIEKPFFIIGCEYVCHSHTCRAVFPQGRKFASTDISILNALPPKLRDEFPAMQYPEADLGSGPQVWCWKAIGVSISLWNMVQGCLALGFKKDQILRLIVCIQQGAGGVVHIKHDDDVSADPGLQSHIASQSTLTADQMHNGGGVHHNGLEAHETAMPDYSDWRTSTSMVDGGRAMDSGPSTAQQTMPTPTQAPPPVQPQPPPQPQSQPQPQPPPQHTQPPPQPQSQPPQPPPQQQPPPQPQPTQPQQPHQTQPHQAQAHPPYQNFISNVYGYPAYSYVIPGMTQHTPTPGSSSSGGHTATPNIGAAPNGHPNPASSSNALKRTYPFSGDHHRPSAGADGRETGQVVDPPPKRSPRHCCKCGSQDCKGRGGNAFCQHPCQDCGRLDCKGRNSRRPDKKCSEGWN